MIQRSESLRKRLEHETVRFAGTLARLVFYKGTMPLRCELVADGERITSLEASELLVRSLYRGQCPKMAEGADYWRIMDANGNCVMQGDRDG